MPQNTHAISEFAAKGEIVIALSQAQREISDAILQLRTSDATALASMSRAVDGLVQSYRAALPILMPAPITTEPRVWDITVRDAGEVIEDDADVLMDEARYAQGTAM